MAATATLLPPGIPNAGGAPQEDESQKTLPKFGTPIPAAPTGEFPRVCRELERAPKGATRFKIRCANFGSDFALMYVLSKDKGGSADEDAAKACYLTASGLAAHVAKLKKASAPDVKVEEPFLIVTQLND